MMHVYITIHTHSKTADIVQTNLFAISARQLLKSVLGHMYDNIFLSGHVATEYSWGCGQPAGHTHLWKLVYVFLQQLHEQNVLSAITPSTCGNGEWNVMDNIGPCLI